MKTEQRFDTEAEDDVAMEAEKDVKILLCCLRRWRKGS